MIQENVSADRTTSLGNPGFRSTSQTTANEHKNNAVQHALESLNSYQFTIAMVAIKREIISMAIILFSLLSSSILLWDAGLQ